MTGASLRRARRDAFSGVTGAAGSDDLLADDVWGREHSSSTWPGRHHGFDPASGGNPGGSLWPSTPPAHDVTHRWEGVAMSGSGDTCVVTVVDALPAFRSGLASALAEAGFTTRETAALDDVQRMLEDHALIVTLMESKDVERFATVRQVVQPKTAVALLETDHVGAYRAALIAGAAAAIPRRSHPDRIVAALGRALDDLCVLPEPIGRSLAARARLGQNRSLSQEQLHWLHALASGRSVRDLADECGYSPRQLFRFLRRLYDEMGVASRHEAVAFAADQGLLSPNGSPPRDRRSAG
jgi:DNA-binding NarL/FixJ family response regulator